MESVLKDPTGKIWKNTDGKILKNVPFNQLTTVNGKIAEYISGDWENVGGFCRTWYDSVGSNNLLQINASNQLNIGSNSKGTFVYGTSTLPDAVLLPSLYPISTRSLIYITKYSTIDGDNPYYNKGLFSNSSKGISTYGQDLIGNTDGDVQLNKNKIIVNNELYPYGSYKGNSYYVVYIEFSSIFPIDKIWNYIYLYTTNTYLLYHLCFFNKTLSNAEIFYNTNALAKKYQITL